MKSSIIFATTALALVATPLAAQSTTTTRDRIGSVLGSLLGLNTGETATIDAQWRTGRTALANQRGDFDARVDSDLRTNLISQATATRLKTDYAALVDLEASYGTDRVYSATERTDLSTRYNALLQVLSDRRYADSVTAPTAEVSLGRADFDTRVDRAVASRKLTRTAGRTLKADYAAVIKIETGYMTDGILTSAESADLDTRLDALDQRVGDIAYTVPVTPKNRLAAIAIAIPTSGLATAVRAQLQVEHGDLAQLEAAYMRTTPTSEEKAYLDRRLTELEARARVSR